MEPTENALRLTLKEALCDILNFWQTRMPDKVYGGFLGAMNHDGIIQPGAAKGAVLHSRILWTFSSAAWQLKDGQLAQVAEDAYQWFSTHFFDPGFGGVYWSVDEQGALLDGKKQIYAQGFAIYALSAYYRLTGNETALQQAIGLYRLIEQHSYDPVNGGYFEAFSRNWDSISDLRLSLKDANEKKTMNTHLHILEGYTLLYKVWADNGLREKIEELLKVFRDKIVQPDTATQGLFFDENWNRKDTLVSYGHDIEASWLLQEAAEAVGNGEWIACTKELAVKMAHASMKGIDGDGGMWYEYDFSNKHLVKEKHWWPQAEALVGFYNAWQNSGDPDFLTQVFGSWSFIKTHLINRQLGEWVWGVYEDYKPMAHEDFAGFWKCPYHNGRACLELLHRMQ